MRILFTSTPGVGHFHPLVPIARAGMQAGHEVAFATPASFVPTVEHSGFRAFPAGMAELPAQIFPELRGLSGRAATEFTWLRVRPAQASAMVTDLLGIINTWRPDLIVRERAEYGGCIAAERCGLPYAAVEINAAQMGQDRRAMLSAGLAAVLTEFGLPPDPDLQIEERQLVLSPFPPSYRGSAPAGAVSLRLPIRPTLFDQSGDEGLPVWIDSLPAQSTVYLTLGTSSLINAWPSIMRAFIDGLANEPLNLIITVGRNNDPADLGPGPSNVRIERYIPQTLLFPRCDLVVCHAGSGTVMAALVHGLPLVLVPIVADQPQNARRCDALGLATVLDVDRLDPTVARTAVRNVLADPRYRQHTETMRAEIEALPGPEQAVIYLERLATHQDLRLYHP